MNIRKKRWSVSVKQIITILICCTCINAPIIEKIESISSVEMILNFGALALFAYVVIIATKKKKYLDYNWLGMLMIVLLFAAQFLSTIINHGRILYSLVSSVKVITVCLWLLCNRKNLWKIFNTIKYYLGVLLTVNLITMILLPDGIIRTKTMWKTFDPMWILSLANSMTPYVLATLILTMVSIQRNRNFKKSKIDYFILAVCVTTSIIANSATQLTGTALLLLPYLYKKVRKQEKKSKVHITAYMVTAITLFLLLVLWNRTDLFSFLVVNVLRRDLTFTSRLRIWNASIGSVVHKPIFGYGIKDITIIQTMLLASHQHDYYLHLLFQGGLLAFVPFVMMLNCCRLSLTKHKSEYNFLLSISLFAFLIVFITESYGEGTYIAPFYIIIILCLSLRDIQKKGTKHV